jgi:4'-phosphopantetheinyl transferase
VAGAFGTLSGGDVHIWLCDPRSLTDAARESAALATLTPEERGRAGRFVFAPDRHAFVAARALARAVLAHHAAAAPDQIAFAVNGYGKPRLALPRLDRELSFNVSHTREIVACAVAWDRPVGVDVETIREPPLDLVDRYFAPPESAALRALAPADQREAFFALWTLKESFIKAIGMGLSMPLDRFAVRWSPPALLPYGDFATAAAEWHFIQASPTGTGRLALCVRVERGAPPVVDTRWASGPLGNLW